PGCDADDVVGVFGLYFRKRLGEGRYGFVAWPAHREQIAARQDGDDLALSEVAVRDLHCQKAVVGGEFGQRVQDPHAADAAVDTADIGEVVFLHVDVRQHVEDLAGVVDD